MVNFEQVNAGWGSVFATLLLNIYLENYFFSLTELTEVYNFADETTFQAFDTDFEDLVTILKHDTNLRKDWYDCNYVYEIER